MTNSIITPDLVDLGLDAPDRQAATRQLAQRLAERGRVTDLDGFLADVAAREQQMPTGIEGGIGIPHARSAFVTEPTLAFAVATNWRSSWAIRTIFGDSQRATTSAPWGVKWMPS